ncbi:MAG: type II secretion system protein GspM [Pseudomonadota bacterium]|jgi:MSHA biogenesis protein MshJ
MKQLWQRHADRYDALTRRERLMVLVAVLAVIVVTAYVIALEPAVARQRAARRLLDQHQAELRNLREQLRTTQAQVKDPDAANRRQLEMIRHRMAEIDERLRRMESTLVSPERMAALLEEVLRRNRNLELISLRNLPATGLLRGEDGIAAGSSRDDKDGRPGPAPGTAAHDGVLFRHGVEITVAGSYADLLAYLAELERMPQRLLWSSLKLTVEEHPRVRLTFIVHTLSPDKAWLTV